MQEIENTADKDFIVVTTATVDKLFSISVDALTLYIFYIKTSKWQKTNQVFTTNTYGMKCLGWGGVRYKAAKAILAEHGLVTVIPKKDAKGRIAGWYIKINHLFKKDTIQRVLNEPLEENPEGLKTTSGSQTTDALSNNTKDALSNNTGEADASTLVAEAKKTNKLSPAEGKLVGIVAAAWKDMAAAALDIPKKEVEDSKLFFSISNVYKREKWDVDDFKRLFKHFFADEGMKRENKLAYSICLSQTYIAKYKLAKKGKVNTMASLSGDIRL